MAGIVQDGPHRSQQHSWMCPYSCQAQTQLFFFLILFFYTSLSSLLMSVFDMQNIRLANTDWNESILLSRCTSSVPHLDVLHSNMDWLMDGPRSPRVNGHLHWACIGLGVGGGVDCILKIKEHNRHATTWLIQVRTEHRACEGWYYSLLM